MTVGNPTSRPPEGESPGAQWRQLQSRYGSYPGAKTATGPGRADMATSRGMTHYQAALLVLKAAERPLSTREITDLAITGGLIVPGGRTPYASMARVLYLRLRRDPELVKVEEVGSLVRWALRRTAGDAD